MRGFISICFSLLVLVSVAQAQTTMQQVFVVKQAFPSIKTIGVLCNTQNAAKILKELTVAGSSYSVEFVIYDVKTVQDLRQQFESLTGARKIDLLWMVQDGVADDRFGRRFLEEKSISNKIPLFTYSTDFVKEGSLMTVSVDASSQIKIFYNRKVSQMLGISFPAELQEKLTPVD